MFYLPIKIRENKLHVCHLDDHDRACMPVYSFLFDKQETTLVTFDKGQSQLISSEKFSDNVPLNNCHFLPIERLSEPFSYVYNNGEELIEKYPIFRLTIVSPSLITKQKKEEHERKLQAIKNGAQLLESVGDERGAVAAEGDESIKLVKDLRNQYIYRLVIDKSKITDERFVIEIVYKESEEKDYICRFRCAYMLNTGDRIAPAALDFGSEASQMKCEINGTCIQIVKKVEDIAFLHDEDKEHIYRQGADRDYLFKSIFFLNPNLPDSSITHWADRPLQYGRDSFLQLLISMKETGYSNWIQLPNLKLLELISSNLQWEDAEIKLPKGSNVNIQDLTFSFDRKNLLRYILSQFLYVAMKVQLGRANYLNFILLVPNVYLQKKIYDVVCGLYQDFDFIRLQNKEFSSWKGMEVQIISESDASFSGYIQSQRPYNKGKKYSLIIDAGKGTTDFSVMLGDSSDNSKFQSVYRAGIPIAGNMMTYAFYEALKLWLNKNGVSIDDKLSKADPDKLIDFMDKLERLKLNYDNAQGTPNAPKEAEKMKNLEPINTYIENDIISPQRGKRLPDIDETLKKRCSQITNFLYQYLHGFVESNNIHFDNVILMGRGFLLKPFMEAVKDMIISHGWAEQDAFLTMEGGAIKTQCLQGALFYKNVDVNCQSGLIGSVSFGDEATINSQATSWWKRIIQYLTGRKSNAINEEFFYNGAHCSYGKANINISCFSQQIRNAQGTDVHVYFIGDGFLVQQNDSAYILNEEDFSHSFDTTLIYESLFPFWAGSIPDPNLEVVEKNRTEGKQSIVEAPIKIEESVDEDIHTLDRNKIEH